MCRLLGVTKQAYYKHGDSEMVKVAQEAFVVEFIKEVRKKDLGIGGNKLWLMYQKQFGTSRSVGYNRFYDIVEKYNLKVRKVKRRVKTTDATHNLPLYPNIVKDLLSVRPCQLIVSDITYIPYFLNLESGNPKDNAVAERVNSTIKNELLKGMSFTSIIDVKKAVNLAINFYNEERPHMSLDGLTPREAAKKKGEINKKWISYREKAIKAKVE